MLRDLLEDRLTGFSHLEDVAYPVPVVAVGDLGLLLGEEVESVLEVVVLRRLVPKIDMEVLRRVGVPGVSVPVAVCRAGALSRAFAIAAIPPRPVDNASGRTIR